MLFSKVVFVVISLTAISVLATPHALNHAALHRRAIAARVASPHGHNATSALRKRQNNKRCKERPTSSQIPTPASAAPTPTHTTSSHVQEQPNTQTTTPPVRVISPSTPVQEPPKTTPTAPTGQSGAFTGDATWFDTGLGACGETNNDSDFICAVSHLRFDAASDSSNSNNNPLCNKKINITFNGKTITVTAVDRCAACGFNDLDLTPTAFQALQSLGVGRFPMEWVWA